MHGHSRDSTRLPQVLSSTERATGSEMGDLCRYLGMVWYATSYGIRKYFTVGRATGRAAGLFVVVVVVVVPEGAKFCLRRWAGAMDRLDGKRGHLCPSS